jgi:hypothetical protein
LQKTAPNIEVFGKILPEKEPKLPKKAVFGLFFCAEIEQKILYVRYFFSNYVENTVRSVFFSNYAEFPSKYRTFGIFSCFSAAFFWRQQRTFGGKRLPAIPNPLTYVL